MSKVYGICILVLSAVFAPALSQNSFEEFKRSRQKELTQFAKKEKLEFEHYRDSMNHLFESYLKNNRWVNTNVNIQTTSEKAKPSLQPVIPNDGTKELKLAVSVQQEVQEEYNDFILFRVFKKKKNQKEAFVPKKSVNFYGEKVGFAYAESELDVARVDMDALSGAWNNLSATDYTSLIVELKTYAKQHNLNGWGYVLLVRSLADVLYDTTNKKTIFTWFMLVNTGFEGVSVANVAENLVLVVPSKEHLLGVNYYKEKGNRKYIFNLFQDSGPSLSELQLIDDIKTLNTSFSDTVLSVEFKHNTKPVFNSLSSKRSIQFNYKTEPIALEISYDDQVVDYLSDFPTLEHNLYFNTPLSDIALNSLKTQLDVRLANLTVLEKVDFLLTLVQQGFEYKIDEDQFGAEKYMFAEESFRYAYNDCEDRSYLFAQLIKTFVHEKIVGVVFPGHVATAVCLNSEIEGTYIEYNNAKYYLCDPTYINAKPGQCMDKFCNSAMKVVKL